MGSTLQNPFCTLNYSDRSKFNSSQKSKLNLINPEQENARIERLK